MAELDTVEPNGSCCSPAAPRRSCCEPEAKSDCCGDAHDDGCGVHRRTDNGGGDRVRGCSRGSPRALRRRRGGRERRYIDLYGNAAGITDEQRDINQRGAREARSARRSPRPPSSRRSAAATRPRSPICTRARRCSTWAREAGSTSCSPPAGSAPTTAYGLDMTDGCWSSRGAISAGRRRRRVPNRHDRGGAAGRRLCRRGDLQLRDLPVRRQAGGLPREAAQVLRPGGRFAVSDVVADPDMDQATRTDMDEWTGHRGRPDPR